MRAPTNPPSRTRSRSGAVLPSTLGLILGLPLLFGAVFGASELGAGAAAAACWDGAGECADKVVETVLTVADPERWHDWLVQGRTTADATR